MLIPVGGWYIGRLDRFCLIGGRRCWHRWHLQRLRPHEMRSTGERKLSYEIRQTQVRLNDLQTQKDLSVALMNTIDEIIE